MPSRPRIAAWRNASSYGGQVHAFGPNDEVEVIILPHQDSDLSFPVTAYKVVEMGLLPSVSWWHRCTSMRSYRDRVLNALRQDGVVSGDEQGF